MVSSSEHRKAENGDKKNTIDKSSLCLRAGLKPLCKHRFYLDIKNQSLVSKIEGKIRGLGGAIDIFLDKDVTHVITDKDVGINNKGCSNSPRTAYCNSKSILSHNGNEEGSPSHVRLKTRVSTMLEKVRTASSHVEKDIFAEADRLGITVWTTEKANIWLDKVATSLKPIKRKKVHEFKAAYIKFESFDRKSRPVFKELGSFPYLNWCGEEGDGGVVSRPSTVAPPPALLPPQNMTRNIGRLTANVNLNTVSSTSASAATAIVTQYAYHRENKEEAVEAAGRHTSIKQQQQRQPQVAANANVGLVALNSGYCELCRVDFLNQSEHLRVESHLAFVRDANNFTQLDCLIASPNTISLDVFLKLNNYKARDTTPFSTAIMSSPKVTARTRTTSLSERGGGGPSAAKTVGGVGPRPPDAGPADCTTAGAGAGAGAGSGAVSARPRRHTTFTNSYLEISVDEDRPPEGARETRELRSTRSTLLKVLEPESDTWSSGRPKRSCIKQKRSLAEDSIAVAIEPQSYYRVEVLAPKQRPATASKDHHYSDTARSPNRCDMSATARGENHVDREGTKRNAASEEKGLIVKFRRMRNSELKQLNNEAVNFLFPRKDDSSSEEDVDENCPDTTVSTTKGGEISVVISSEDDTTIDDVQEINETEQQEQITNKSPKKYEIDLDEDQSVDSNWSACNKKHPMQNSSRRRRTHAEAFINDNQKYYKFETPGSRLRYQGSFMSSHDLSLDKSTTVAATRLNGECSRESATTVVKETKSEQPEEEEEDEEEEPQKFSLDEQRFSFEQSPASEPWYQTFCRQDRGQEVYRPTLSDSGPWKPLYLPHQLPPLQPLDPRLCYAAYDQLKRAILEEVGLCQTPSSTGNSTPTDSNNGHNTNHDNGADDPDYDPPPQPPPAAAAAILARAAGGGNSTSRAASPGDMMSDSCSGSSNGTSRVNAVVDGGGKGLEGEREMENGGGENQDFKAELELRRQRRQKRLLLKAAAASGSGRNARKSPRQHASTLAILSSFLQQRKRREMNRSKSDLDESNPSDINGLSTIKEERDDDDDQINESIDGASVPSIEFSEPISAEAKELEKLISTNERMNALVAAETEDIDDFDVQLNTQNAENLVESYCKMDAIAILEEYEKYKDVQSKTGLSHGANRRSFSPGKKPGRKPKKKRKNMTGWPNKNVKRLIHFKKEMDDSTIDSLSVTADSEDLDDTNDNSILDDSNDTSKLEDLNNELDNSLSPINYPNPQSPAINNSSSRQSRCRTEKPTANSLTNNKQFITNNCVNSKGTILHMHLNSNRVNMDDDEEEEEEEEEDEDAEADTETEENQVHNATSVHSVNKSKDNEEATAHCDSDKLPGDKLQATCNSDVHSDVLQLQPVVRVEKLNNRQLRSSGIGATAQATSPRRVAGGGKKRSSTRRMPASPKSPRVLRKPRGRWYRER